MAARGTKRCAAARATSAVCCRSGERSSRIQKARPSVEAERRHRREQDVEARAVHVLEHQRVAEPPEDEGGGGHDPEERLLPDGGRVGEMMRTGTILACRAGGAAGRGDRSQL